MCNEATVFVWVQRTSAEIEAASSFNKSLGSRLRKSSARYQIIGVKYIISPLMLGITETTTSGVAAAAVDNIGVATRVRSSLDSASSSSFSASSFTHFSQQSDSD